MGKRAASSLTPGFLVLESVIREVLIQPEDGSALEDIERFSKKPFARPAVFGPKFA